MKTFVWQAKDERILFFWRENIIRYLIYQFFSFIIMLVWFFIIWILFVVFRNFDWIFSTVVIIFLLIVFLFILFRIFLIFYFWTQTYLVITNKRIIKFVRNWLFTSHIREITIFSLQECVAKYTWFIDKVLNCWIVSFIWKDEKIVITFYWLSNPDEVSMYASRLRDFLIENPHYDNYKLSKFMSRRLRKKIFKKW